MAKRWTPDEDRNLLMGLGAYGVAWFRPRVGRSYDYKGAPPQRTAAAIYGRVRRLNGGGGLGRGAFSLRAMIRNSGYTETQIMRARDALNQKWKRISPGGMYIVTEEQSEDVYEWLKHDYWCAQFKLYACVMHGKPDRQHHTMGMCNPCFQKWKRALRRLSYPIDRPSLLVRLKSEAEQSHGAETLALVRRLYTNLLEGRDPRCHELRQLYALLNPTHRQGCLASLPSACRIMRPHCHVSSSLTVRTAA